MITPRGRGQPMDGADCVGLIVGIMLGTGIFTVFPTLAAARNPSVFMILLAWVVGTLVALCGAFCFAELTARFPMRPCARLLKTRRARTSSGDSVWQSSMVGG